MTIHDLFNLHLENDSCITVKELLARKKNQKLYCMKPTSHLNHAIAIMMMKQISRIPIIDQNPNGSNEFVGWLTLQDIEKSYSMMQLDIDPVELRNHLIEITPKKDDK